MATSNPVSVSVKSKKADTTPAGVSITSLAGGATVYHMTPHSDLISTGFALANPGQEYLIDEPSGGSMGVDSQPAPRSSTSNG